MTKKNLKFEDFEVEKLSKNEQKTVRGGDAADDEKDPIRGGGGGGGTP
jgi:hypothetical protein